jgi:cytochrome P450 family 628
MELAYRTQLLALAAGVCSHHTYFIRGEHLTNVPRILALAILTFAGSVVSLLVLSQRSLIGSVKLVSELYGLYLSALSISVLVYRAFFHRLHTVPGPFGARLTKFYHVHSVRHLDQYRWLDELHQKYGPVVRVGGSAQVPLLVSSINKVRPKLCLYL